MTLKDLAEKCVAHGARTSESTLSRIERRAQVPRPKLRSVLASLLDLDVNDFEPDSHASTEASGSAA